MQHTTCTEDRIQHALDRCLDGLRTSPTAAHHWNVLMCSAGQSMNRWSLEELVKRDPENFLILLQQIIRKTREAQEQCQYELVPPLAIMFTSTLLQTPYCPPHSELLEEALEVFYSFLTWPEPYCSVCRELLSMLQLEIKAPGISFQRLVREEQGLNTPDQTSKTMSSFLGILQTLPLPTAKTYTFHWEKDNFDVLHTLLERDVDEFGTSEQQEAVEEEEEKEAGFYSQQDLTEYDEESGAVDPALIVANSCNSSHRVSTFSTISSLSTTSKDSMYSTLSVASESYPPSIYSGVDSDYFEDSDDYISSSPVAEKCSPKSSKVSTRLSQHFHRLFIKPKNPRMLSRAKSLGNSESKDILVVRETRSNSLPQQVRLFSSDSLPRPQIQALRHVCFRRRPILSSDEDNKNTTLRVVVFGADHVAGKVARAYSSLRKNESACPRLTRAFNLQFYFVPVKRDPGSGHRRSSTPLVQTGSPKGSGLLLLMLACGERRTEVFVHSLELGHTAGTRAIKAMGAASKRFGIDGDREAVPLTLDVVYNRVVVSGRSQWRRETKVCTSVNLIKACKNPEELDSKMECLQLTMTEVLKRQNGKSKKGYNQLSVTEVKVDKVQVSGVGNTTFAVCLDQDEKKILQSVTRCEISVCYKPDSSTDWRLRKSQASAQIQPLNPTFCSLLCLPIVTFSGALP
ncbi:PREDICTED: phosphoinositide 3-kinase regulatory subunit 5-like [Cyprinodon variegatus]|uniref:phosphoinositide 3-kinase regulatory subunit 5-like n=1 Tax=Cyprinodon variegatus TaxID=28743 RepID=UPI00074250DB|nr:PREDICTED: phosphoinositide 3-kinase regulatory subunit 5-like [Cyprinodon variegatus]